MAKAKKIEQVIEVEVDATMPMGPNGNELIDADLTPIEVGFQPILPIEEVESVKVDAAGRKSSVDITHEQLEEKGLKNKSQVIRYLDGEGYSRSAIATFLNIRYQHVRNVLVTPLKKV